ncbi:uncharacterized protein LTHEOB_3309 [Neofusicoccum parvum]|nr:uncharacterized protein LTHEOB_3309 [Neofusicoccum parvum]
MHVPHLLLPLLFSLPLTRAAINDPCGLNKSTGVCLETSACTDSGGTTINDACPNDPAGVKCCSKATCGSGGTCKFTSACAGTSQPNLCPGPDNFKCCIGRGSGSGFPAPDVPSVGACKKVSVDGARAIVAANEGKVKTDAGKAIAEWVMNHRKSLDLKYVIWGQRIWNPSRDGVKPWGQWRKMEDRGSVTANHWDHVHCSFNG